MPPVESKVKVEIRAEGYPKGPITEEEAKVLLGWETPAEGKKFDDFVLKDAEKNQVRLKNNTNNRPFDRTNCDRIVNEFLRGTFAFNGAVSVFDDKGHVVSAAHRLTALILANQIYRANPSEWKGYGHGKDGITMPTILVTGIKSKHEIADTVDTGKSRSLPDVIFRHKRFAKVSTKVQKTLAKELGVALRLVWLRTGGGMVSDAPKFPHTKAMEFLKKHPKLQEALETLYGEEAPAEGKTIKQYLSLGYAAGLMYLMATSKTKEGGEVDFRLWDKAEKFWITFASGVAETSGDLFNVLRSKLLDISTTAQGRDERCGTVIKAWELWLAGTKEAKKADLTVKKRKNDNGKTALAEEPRLGGLDVSIIPEAPEEAAPEAAPEAEKPAKAAKPKKAATKADKPAEEAPVAADVAGSGIETA